MNASYLGALAVALVVVAGVYGGDEPRRSLPTPSEPDLLIDPDAARAFPARVQPVLMNLCANCHCRTDHPSAFKLARVTDAYANATATNRNLRATAAFVRADSPALSPLLVKAVTPHGGAKDPPLVGRGHPAFKHLETWAFRALLATGSPAKPVAPTVATTEPAKVTPAPTPDVVPAAAIVPAQPTPTRLNNDDPFDPAAFNQAARGAGK